MFFGVDGRPTLGAKNLRLAACCSCIHAGTLILHFASDASMEVFPD